MLTSSPSRIQAVPRPMITIQWKRDQGSRSRRAGILVLIVPVSTPVLTAATFLPRAGATRFLTCGE